MKTQRTTVLITVSGLDAPGITSEMTRLLAEASATKRLPLQWDMARHALHYNGNLFRRQESLLESPVHSYYPSLRRQGSYL